MHFVIPHFSKYSLLTKKYQDFELFRQIILIMSVKGHWTEEGFIKVLNLRYNLNLGISEEVKKFFPSLLPVEKPLVPEREISPEWLVGFIDGEGSFNIITEDKITSSSTTPVTRKVWLYFQITQHERDILLLERIVTYLGCGMVKKRNTLTFNTCDYKLSNFHMIDSKIIPFFKKYFLQSAKNYDFKCFMEGADIIRSKQGRQWIPEQFDKIKNIQSNMNKYTKENLVENRRKIG
uniref:GIY-YIG endonuclease n=1 Tax=Juglanconis juglandina TaxID=1940567 RepID=A0A291LIW3_9PEZI|nr:GIY-YIG endonuclease [Juglanconis juglandina]